MTTSALRNAQAYRVSLVTTISDTPQLLLRGGRPDGIGHPSMVHACWMATKPYDTVNRNDERTPWRRFMQGNSWRWRVGLILMQGRRRVRWGLNWFASLLSPSYRCAGHCYDPSPCTIREGKGEPLSTLLPARRETASANPKSGLHTHTPGHTQTSESSQQKKF